MYVCVRCEQSCICVLDESGHVFFCKTWVVMYFCVRRERSSMYVLDVSGHMYVY